MKIIRLAVERPVTTMMFYAALVLLGIISLFLLPQELFPTVTYPELLVITRYGAAAPEEIENIVSKVIEEQAGTIPNLKKVRSISREGVSIVVLEFNWGADMGLAHLAVREKIDLIKDRLPTEADEPIVQRHNPFAQPLMILSISGDLSLSDLTRLSSDVIKKRLQKVDGVASASVSGGQTREVLVEVDLAKMQSSNISISGLVDALKTSNVNYPAGTTQGRFYEYLVRTIGEFKKINEIGKTVVAVDAARESPEFAMRSQGNPKKGLDTFQPRGQRLIPLSDIAEIKDTFKEPDSYSRHNAKTNISIAIRKQFDANTVLTARRVRRALEELSLSLPREMKVEVVYDESTFIVGSLRDVITDAVLGGILAFLVLLFFLRSVQDALIVTISLPISILVVFTYQYFAGRSINVIALAGLSLGIGSIIDNSIAVLDNIVEFREKTGDPIEASINGAGEIAVAQMASMMTNIAVFFPLLFAKGLAQQLFKDLFFAAVISNIAALVVALTLLPRITAYPFRPPPGTKTGTSKSNEEEDVLIGARGLTSSVETNETESARSIPDDAPLPEGNRFKRALAWFMRGLTPQRAETMNSFYRSVLQWALHHRAQIALWVAGMLVMSLAIFYFQPKIFMPSVDQGQFILRVNMPVGTRLEVTNRVIQRIENVMTEMPIIKDTLVRVGAGAEESVEALGSNQGEAIVTVNREKTKQTTEEVILALKEKIKSMDMEGGELEWIQQGGGMKGVGGGSAPISIMVKGPDLGVLRRMSDDIQRLLKTVPGAEGVKTSLPLPSYETRVSIDKDRASGFSLSVSEIARSAMIGIRGFVATYFKEEGKEIPIRVRLREEDRNDGAAIQRVAIRSQQGMMVVLGDVAHITSGYGPSQIQRIDQQRAIVVTSQILGRGMGETLEDVQRKLSTYAIPKDYTLTLGGAKQEIEESFGGLAIAFILSVLLIYMIMAAGFESLLHPFLIMVTVPLGVIGVAFILFVTRTPLSAPVILGIVLLGGIVVNNGIVLIDQINLLRRKGANLQDAVVNGCVGRLKPVIMTALTTILSLVPIALGLGQGTEVSSPMAIATLGGLMISTGLTLIIMPVLYITVEEYRSRQAGSEG